MMKERRELIGQKTKHLILLVWSLLAIGRGRNDLDSPRVSSSCNPPQTSVLIFLYLLSFAWWQTGSSLIYRPLTFLIVSVSNM